MIRRHHLVAFALLPVLTLACSGNGTVNETPTSTEAPKCDQVLQSGEVVVDSPFDADGDGYVDSGNTDCQVAYPQELLDCDDTNSGINPSVEEVYCTGLDEDCDPLTLDEHDGDLDGFSLCSTCEDGSCGDCDDSDSQVAPGLSEICDGLDNNCENGVDEGVQLVFYLDADGDGFGVESTSIEACDPPLDYVENFGDCNDEDSSINPDSVEVCGGVDEDCDGLVDDDDDSVDPASFSTFYPDFDEDGYGYDNDVVNQCSLPDGYEHVGGDCDDQDALVNPGLEEIAYNGFDDDCDATTPDDDLDGDGYPLGEDCNDELSEINPSGIEEPYNGIDEDCNPGSLDDDLDQDGFGYLLDCDDENAQANPEQDEVAYNGIDDDCNELTADDDLDNDTFILAEDCDDSNPDVNPEQVEIPYNGIDDDCDFSSPDDDVDGDGYLQAEDCDDNNPDLNPQAFEVCDGVDNDCDEVIDGLDDSLSDGTTYFADADGDSYGDANSPIVDCELPKGAVDNDSDCDDTRADLNPETLWYVDADSDLYGDEQISATVQCEQPDGYVQEAGDCDDGDPAYNPGVEEGDCTDPADYNCDGSVGYADEDGDGFAACAECDDLDAERNPEADELCDDIDNDCDEKIDDADDDVVEPNVFYADEDEDGYGDAQLPIYACLLPLEAVENSDDCNDADGAINPQATEVPYDGQDNDCNAETLDDDLDEDGYVLAEDCNDESADISPGAEETVYDEVDNDCNPETVDDDLDGDGYMLAEDCNDLESSISPEGVELCDEVDQDCDEVVDEGVQTDFYEDLDGDTFGNGEQIIASCSQPDGFVAVAGDCNDEDDSVYPGQEELLEDQVDNDCDISVDEDLVWIPTGDFVMGSDVSDPGSLAEEGPERQVSVQEFFIERFEVSNGQYVRFLNLADSNTSAEGKQFIDLDDEDVKIYIDEQTGLFAVEEGLQNHPVIEVTWYGARDYCSYFGKALPSEAQWEYVARGPCGQECDVSEDGSDSELDEPAYPWGNEQPTCELANFNLVEGACVGETLPVDALIAGHSVFGVAAMAGNVREWTQDCLHGDYEGAPSTGEPWLEECELNFPLIRGGSFNSDASEIRVSSRYDSPASTADNDIGFRCIRMITDGAR